MSHLLRSVPVLLTCLLISSGKPVAAEADLASAAATLNVEKGIIAVLGFSEADAPAVVKLASNGGPRIYFQSKDTLTVSAVRQAAEAAQVLTVRVSADAGPLSSIHLSENLADGILVAEAAADQVSDAEVLRVLRPRGIAMIGKRRLMKPVP
ncbi:MAG: hypothetical protein HQ518_03540, partial [Rhodopirellula sp.]|nr:hypothetical protein [Rhodopirellula sp.]